MHTGDKDTISKFYEVAINYLKLWELGDNGLIKIINGSWIWTDWGEKIDVEVIQNVWYYYALSIVEKMSIDLEITENNSFISTTKESISNNFAIVYKKK